VSETATGRGLSLAPFRALRFTAGPELLGGLLCPPYDVIDVATRTRLLTGSANNAVQIVLPQADPSHSGDAQAYRDAAATLQRWVDEGIVAADETAGLYVYEMQVPATGTETGAVTRGLVGAVELRDPDDGVILPHENTMAGPVSDRLALMDATDANLEPIYLVYDGGAAASAAVASARNPSDGPADDTSTEKAGAPKFVAQATTDDGVTHRLWAITDLEVLTAIEADLNTRHALIADGHHRYATYRQLAEQRRVEHGAGPWDRGLALLVDSSAYGPQVHPIHRVIPHFEFDRAAELARNAFTVTACDNLEDAQSTLSETPPSAGFAVIITDGDHAAVITQPDADLVASTRHAGEPVALLDLDVTVLHRVLIERTWALNDDEATVGYAHSVGDALVSAQANGGLAVLLRATPVGAVAAVAAAGARMPRKSTLFTPKPASGLVMRRFSDA
jgi:uncharacterized protein (DUF1015 family)